LVTERATDRLVHEMCRGVGPRDRLASLDIDGRNCAAADDDLAGDDAAAVNNEVRQRFLRIVDPDDRAVAERDLTVVGELATRLRVERGAIEHDLDLGAFGRRVEPQSLRRRGPRTVTSLSTST